MHEVVGATGGAEARLGYDQVKYLLMAVDPVHVGTGEYRLGRVDNTIVREPGTGLPKVPGTSLAGPARAHSAMVYDGGRHYRTCAGKENNREGAGGDHDGRCETPDACHVCLTYGYTLRSGKSRQGLAQLYDAQILFFPVYSMSGPVWVTSPRQLLDALNVTVSVESNKLMLSSGIGIEGPAAGQRQLNLGWLLLEAAAEETDTVDIVAALDTIGDTLLGSVVLKGILERLVIVDDDLFSHVVNSNLEVRTSVAIDPATGAAEDGALFTYEAIPRATVMAFDVVYNDPVIFFGRDESPIASLDVINMVEEGMRLFETFGIGGMNTRGMGRVRLLGRYHPGDEQPEVEE